MTESSLVQTEWMDFNSFLNQLPPALNAPIPFPGGSVCSFGPDTMNTVHSYSAAFAWLKKNSNDNALCELAEMLDHR